MFINIKFIFHAFIFAILLYYLLYVNKIKNSDLVEKLMHLNHKLEQLQSISLQRNISANYILQAAIANLNSDISNDIVVIDHLIELLMNEQAKYEPLVANEKLRRRVYGNCDDLLQLVETKVQPHANESTSVSEIKRSISNQTREARSSLLNKIEELADLDYYNHWRWNSANSASDLVQRRLLQLQNPANCSTAKKLVCALDIDCGFGCQYHHIMYCLVMAYANERTLILHPNSWRVRIKSKVWEDIFEPVSSCHLDSSETSTIVDWNRLESKHHQDHKVINITKLGYIKPRPAHLPLAVPIDLKPSLEKFHGNPSAWWIGQIIKFFWKPAEATQLMLDQTSKKLGFKTPIVGVHIRRTDKKNEAEYYELDEYMYHVDKYYQKLEMKEEISQRRIFLASDEPKVFEEIKRNYPQYEVIKDDASPKPVQLSKRYKKEALDGIILDTHLLSLCDYLVCTLSSNICRLAYELMQSRHVDASNKIKSLDNDYHYPGQHTQYREVVLSHSPRGEDEIQMEVGDDIDVGTHRMMPSDLDVGKNERTQKQGKFPSFKTVNKIRWEDFPLYPRA